MGVGILAAFLNTYLNFTKAKFVFVFLSLCEAFLLYKVFYWLVYKSTIMSIMLLAFALLIISFYNSAGIISRFLNKQHWIYYFSKYVYSIFVIHSVCLMYLTHKITKPLPFYLSVIFSSIILGVVVHHITEKLIPTAKNIFRTNNDKNIDNSTSL